MLDPIWKLLPSRKIEHLQHRLPTCPKPSYQTNNHSLCCKFEASRRHRIIKHKEIVIVHGGGNAGATRKVHGDIVKIGGHAEPEIKSSEKPHPPNLKSRPLHQGPPGVDHHRPQQKQLPCGV